MRGACSIFHAVSRDIRARYEAEVTRWTCTTTCIDGADRKAAKSLSIISIVRQDHNWCAINIARLE